MAGNKHDNGVHEMGTEEMRNAYQEDTPGQTIEEYIEETQKLLKQQKKKHFSQVFQNPLKGFPYNEEFEVKPINEKVEYVEYKFKNKGDAQKALDYFKSQQLIKLDINDDGLSQGELTIDAGKKDMTKYHKEVMRKFKPKVQTQEQSEDKLPDLDDIDSGLFEIEDLENGKTASRKCRQVTCCKGREVRSVSWYT